MSVQLTSAKNCAECGSEFTVDIIEAGGSREVVLIIRGHQIAIPGLYRCTGCDEAIKMGARASQVTLESARDYLNDCFGPMMVRGLQLTALNQDEAMFAKCMDRLGACMDTQSLLEACIELLAEPGGLDFIPECDGHCGEDHADPRSMAHLN